MPRPAKCRRVCHYPKTAAFSPAPVAELRPPVVLTVDEYEAIRLIDAEGFSQEQCSQSMEIARTTVQKIYESARKKLAAMLVEGRPLQIEGGAFRLCDGRGAPCGCPGCYKRQIGAQYQKPEGEQVMRIAIPYENGQVFQHFGHTQQFKIYDTDGEAVTASQIVDTEGQGHGALAGLLSALQVDVLVWRHRRGGQERPGGREHPPVRRRVRRSRHCGQRPAGGPAGVRPRRPLRRSRRGRPLRRPR